MAILEIPKSKAFMEAETAATSFQEAISSFVVIVVDSVLEAKSVSHMGCGISEDVVFTMRHLWEVNEGTISSVRCFPEDSIFHGGRGINASIQSIPANFFMAEQNEFDLTTDEIPLKEPYVDFGVLRLDQPINNVRLLKLPKAWRMLNVHGHPVFMGLGLPANLTSDLKSYFPRSFKHIISSSVDSPTELFRRVVDQNLFGIKYCLATFGSTHPVLNAESNTVACTMSMVEGFSGGPVIDTENPAELAGFIYARFEGTSMNYFLRADCQLVLACYRHFCETTRSNPS